MFSVFVHKKVMCMSVPYRPLKQWCIVLWSRRPPLLHSIKSKHRIQTRGRRVQSPKFPLEEQCCSLVAHLLVLLNFLASWRCSPRLCCNYKCSVHCVKAFGDGRCGLYTQGPKERKIERTAVNTLSLALKMHVVEKVRSTASFPLTSTNDLQ